MTGKKVKSLYNMERDVWVELLGDSIARPPDSIDPGRIVFFRHIDGMYSLCKRPDGRFVHPAAWTKARIVEAP